MGGKVIKAFRCTVGLKICGRCAEHTMVVRQWPCDEMRCDFITYPHIQVIAFGSDINQSVKDLQMHLNRTMLCGKG